jgi:hypothetical protein
VTLRMLLTGALLASAVCLHAQDLRDAPAFEVASIKLRGPGSPPPGAGGPPSPDRYTRPNSSLRDLIQDAYGLQRFQIAGGPNWLTGPPRFEVTARAPFVPSAAQRALMVHRTLRPPRALRNARRAGVSPSPLTRRRCVGAATDSHDRRLRRDRSRATERRHRSASNERRR